MGPGDTVEHARRLREVVARTRDVDELRSIAFALVEAAGEAAITDRSPEYGYGRTERDRDRLGQLPEAGQRWATPREILGDTLRDLTLEVGP